MAGFGSIISDIGFNVTNGLINQTLATQLNNLEHYLIHGEHKGVRFYYNQSGGGNVLQVMTKALVGGAISELGSLAKNVFKDLLWKDNDKLGTTSKWTEDRIAEIKREKAKEYGKMSVGNGYIFAIDHHGYRCRDALMLRIPLPEGKTISYSQQYRNEDVITGYNVTSRADTQYKSNSGSSQFIVWYDTVAIVNVESSKNLVITQVQGRDYSRKELVSNGDININVSGYITSPYPDIYPKNEVNKLKQILRYKGIVDVNNQILDNWDVEKIVIKDFNFPQEEGGKSVQRYSFSAVAVQPEKLSEVENDTIKIIEQPFETGVKEENKWADLLEKQLERLKRGASELADTGVSIGGEILMDSILDKNT